MSVAAAALARALGQGRPPTADSPELASYLQVLQQPVIPISLPSTITSKVLLSRPLILMGWSLRETSGTAPVVLELLNGADATGEIVAEVTIPAPLPGASGFSDVDVDSTANTAAAANTATLAGAAGATTYITGFEITALGATGQATVTVTVAGILGGSKVYYIDELAGIAVAIPALVVEYARPIPASAANTAITVAATSPGAGNTAFSVTAHGFQRTVGATAANSALSVTADLDASAPFCRGGLYLSVVAGSVKGSVWVRA